MKYTVKIADKRYEVEIDNIYARPVVVHVDGERFEVMPENGIRLDEKKESVETSPVMEKSISGAKPLPAASPTSNPSPSGKTLTSPLPGTVTEIFVKKGDKVEAGQVILIIEAMKMKNSIRSVRTGVVAGVLVSAGQTVAHKQALVEFAE
ncbi:MAG: biotin/lipoyl-binding protein [Chloroflexi bacterium]|nr:biotin/lipoyl-binding protein [Chloroflexota bacterium]